MTSRILMAAALCTALAACGGDGSDPADRTFTYGAPAAVTVGSPEYYASQDGSLALSDGAACQAAPGDPMATENAGGSLATMPDAMAGTLFGDTGMGAFAPAGLAAKAIAGALSRGGFQPQSAIGEGFDDPSCVHPTPMEVVYDHCSITDTLNGITMTVNGRFTLATNAFDWDATVGIHMSDIDFDVDGTNHLYGRITFDASTIRGRARSDMVVTVTAAMQRMTAGTVTVADLDLQYAADPFCVTGGTLEVKRIWDPRPAGMPSTGEYADRGAKFTWSGCGTVLVQLSQ